jgi:large subunit ribosomal protein L9
MNQQIHGALVLFYKLCHFYLCTLVCYNRHIMKVILLKDIAKLGKRGEVKEVADGYAVNVLIKKEFALQATPSELAKWKAKEEAKAFKKEVATNTFLQVVQAIKNTNIVISGKKHDDKGQLFAQIKETDIVDAIYNATKFSLDPKQIIISLPIKKTGEHQVIIKQGEKNEKITIVIKG